MTVWADPDDVAEAAEGWSEGQIECRALGQHPWRNRTWFVRGPATVLVQRCPRCLNERVRDLDSQGYWVSEWRRSYEPGYLLVGKGRLGDDARAPLRLQMVASSVVRS